MRTMRSRLANTAAAFAVVDSCYARTLAAWNGSSNIWVELKISYLMFCGSASQQCVARAAFLGVVHANCVHAAA